jgi:hypothetical protein
MMEPRAPSPLPSNVANPNTTESMVQTREQRATPHHPSNASATCER